MSDNIKANQEELINDLLAHKISSEAAIEVLFGVVQVLLDEVYKHHSEEVRKKLKDTIVSLRHSQLQKGLIEYVSKNQDFDNTLGDALKDILS